jgi:catechol 2,3-dioxygenase-like lactoylglutathione lyase family enzyme
VTILVKLVYQRLAHASFLRIKEHGSFSDVPMTLSVHSPRPVDHLVLAVRDLDATGAFYERLGFRVGGTNYHPWGTLNRLIQFDGMFLELISVGEGADIVPHTAGTFSFGAFVQDALDRREGLAMLALASRDAKADADAFKQVGLGDLAAFHFERIGQGPDGSPRRVAFTLAFARDAMAPEVGLFVCQHHVPENFWNKDVQVHVNGARGVSAVTMVAENPSDHHVPLEAFTGVRAPSSTSMGMVFQLPAAQGLTTRFEVLTPVAAAQFYGESALPNSIETGFIGFRIAVADLVAAHDRLAKADIPCLMQGTRLIVPASAAFGCAIAFEA